MHRSLLAFLCSASLAAVAGAPRADASELGRAALERAVSNAEFRGTLTSRRGAHESHLWRFMGDGNIHAVLLRYRVLKANSGTEHQDLGRWWIEGNRLCIHWNELMFAKVSCYSVRATNGAHVDFFGPEHIAGTLSQRQ